MANKNENVNICKGIAEELEKHVNGKYFRCSECSDVFTWDDVEDGEYYHCPHCGDMILEGDLEQLGIIDWLGDALDIEFRCSERKEYRSARVMVACGGPNIYIDTASKQVKLYLWSERASYPISSDAAAVLDDCLEEYWDCL